MLTVDPASVVQGAALMFGSTGAGGAAHVGPVRRERVREEDQDRAREDANGDDRGCGAAEGSDRGKQVARSLSFCAFAMHCSIIEQRYWSDFLAEPSLAQIEAAARPKTEVRTLAMSLLLTHRVLQGGDSPQKSPRTGDADLDLVKEANSELNVSGTVLFASELCRQSEAGSTDQFIAPDDASETSQHYSHVRMSSFRARSSGDDADFETKETRKVKRAGQSSSSDSDEEIVFEERGSPSAVRRGPPRRAGDRPMRGALQRAQKHVLGVWSASPRGSSPR
eukprot:3503752-Rhodomonas_salina.1